MKKLLQLAILMALGLGVACEGPEGPEGPQGEPGTQGPAGAPGVPGPAGEDAQTATVMDMGGWTFEADEEGNYGLGITFSDYGIELQESDIVMVYRMTFYDEQDDVLVWSPLPITVVTDNGIVQYSFVYTYLDMGILIDSQFDLAEYPGITDEQVFRIVVLPGEAVANARLGGRQPGELSSLSYKEVLKTFNLSDEEVPLIQLR